MSTKYAIGKLFTHEDKFNFHKICGLLVILNYFLQIYLYIGTNTIWLPFYVLLPHILLHVTSLNFKVLSQRPVGKKSSMFIWNELRMHSMIFAYRAIFAIIFPEYSRIIVFVTMIAADIVSKVYGNSELSTVRGDHSRYEKTSLKKKLLSAFFSSSQLGATLICSGCFQPSVSPILAFLTLPAIQTSAFGMTLLRKNIIEKNTWTFIYSLELILVYLGWIIVYDYWILLYCFLLYIFRIKIRNKYLLWLIVCALDHHLF